jgi:hypothetical protein
MALNVRRAYDVQLVLGRERPWKPAVWKKIAASLDPVFGAPAKTSVSTNQKLGKLGWANHKWTAADRFAYLHAWSPSRADFARTGQPPNAFLHVKDPRSFGEGDDEVASWVLLAVAVDAEVRGAAEECVPAFVKTLDPVEHYVARRAWARRVGRDSFDDSLQDFLLTLERNEETGRLRIPAVWKRARRA